MCAAIASDQKPKVPAPTSPISPMMRKCRRTSRHGVRRKRTRFCALAHLTGIFADRYFLYPCDSALRAGSGTRTIPFTPDSRNHVLGCSQRRRRNEETQNISSNGALDRPDGSLWRKRERPERLPAAVVCNVGSAILRGCLAVQACACTRCCPRFASRWSAQSAIHADAAGAGTIEPLRRHGGESFRVRSACRAHRKQAIVFLLDHRVALADVFLQPRAIQYGDVAAPVTNQPGLL
jgi:hypothetical protein